MAKAPDHDYGGCVWCQNKCIGTSTAPGGRAGGQRNQLHLGGKPPRNPFVDTFVPKNTPAFCPGIPFFMTLPMHVSCPWLHDNRLSFLHWFGQGCCRPPPGTRGCSSRDG